MLYLQPGCATPAGRKALEGLIRHRLEQQHFADAEKAAHNKKLVEPEDKDDEVTFLLFKQRTGRAMRGKERYPGCSTHVQPMRCNNPIMEFRFGCYVGKIALTRLGASGFL